MGGGQRLRIACAVLRSDCGMCQGSADLRLRGARWRRVRSPPGCNSRDKRVPHLAGVANAPCRWPVVRTVYRARRVRRHRVLRPSRGRASVDQTACAAPRPGAYVGDPGPQHAARIAHPRSEQATRPAALCAGCPGANLPLDLEHSDRVSNLTLFRPGTCACLAMLAAPRGIDAKLGQQIDQRAEGQTNDIKITAINTLGWLEGGMLDAISARLVQRVAGGDVIFYFSHAVWPHQDGSDAA